MTAAHLAQSVAEPAPRSPSDDPVDVAVELVCSGQRLEQADALRGARLINRDLSGANLAGADLTGADLSRANLTGASLVGATLKDATLFSATLDQAELLDADLRKANLTEASATGAGFGRANLEGATLFNALLNGASFTQSNLTSVDLRAANLTGARLRECQLEEADLSRAVLRNVDLRESHVRRSLFVGADLRGCKMAGLRGAPHASWIDADIAGVDFCGAYLVRRQIEDQNYLHEFRRQSRTTEWIYWIWWATSDCGRSFLRWGVWTGALALLYALVYLYVDIDIGDQPHNWMTTIYFSIVTLTTLGYGDIVPSSTLARFITLTEVMIGYVMLGGLLGIFANKMARRAG